MWVVALLLFWAVLVLGLSVLRRGRSEALTASGACPTCRAELRALRVDPAVQPTRAWEVLVCPPCGTAVPAVQGIPSRSGWCPMCRQRAMELHASWAPDATEADPRAIVRERCHLCGHEDELEVGGTTRQGRGRVIPFPGGRAPR